MSTCPICGSSTSTRKVSAVWREQSAGMHTTQLAYLFEPPRRVGTTPWAAIGCGGLLIVGWAPILGIILLVALMGEGSAAGFLVGLVAVIGGVIWAAHALRKSRANAENPKRDAQYDIWSRLYYCQKDDVVFDPLTGRYTSPNNIGALYGRG